MKELYNPAKNSEHKNTFNYQLLGRLQSDCKYFLGYGNRCERDLWAGDVARQIETMLIIYDYLEGTTGAPRWITKEEIADYNAAMNKTLTFREAVKHACAGGRVKTQKSQFLPCTFSVDNGTVFVSDSILGREKQPHPSMNKNKMIKHFWNMYLNGFLLSEVSNND